MDSTKKQWLLQTTIIISSLAAWIKTNERGKRKAYEYGKEFAQKEEKGQSSWGIVLLQSVCSRIEGKI